jgi:hypothetical protein
MMLLMLMTLMMLRHDSLIQRSLTQPVFFAKSYFVASVEN